MVATWPINANLIIALNITLIIRSGALFSLVDGVTLINNGPFQAGLYLVFSSSGTGKLVFECGAVKEDYPQW